MMLFIQGLRKRYRESQIWMIFGCGQEKNFRDMVAEVISCDKIMLVRSSHFKSIGIIWVHLRF